MDIRTCGEPELDALNDRAKVWREQHSPKIRTELKTSRHTAAGQAPAKASSSGSLMGPPPSEAQIEGALVCRSGIPPTRLANGLYLGWLYEKSDPGRAHGGVENSCASPNRLNR